MKASNNKNSKKRKFILLGIGFGVLALGGFGYWYFKGRKGVKLDNSNDDIFRQLTNENKTPKINASSKPNAPKTQPPVPKSSNTPAPSPSLSSFPLKNGSRSELVKKLQDALIKTYGKSILPKYGADGQFGSETTTALKSKGFSTIIDEATYNKIVGITAPVNPTGLDATDKENIDITKNIWLNLSLKKLSPLIDTLKRIKSVPHYVKVNELFKTIRLNGVRQTIVNASLTILNDDTSKQFIKNEFIRIGLKYDGEKWSLAGFNEKQIISTQETTICSIDGCTLKVPAQTILGIQLTRGKHNTRFRTFNNQILYVPTKHINHV